MFNLKKYAQNTNDSDFVESLAKNTNITNVRPDLQDTLKDTKDNIKNPNKNDIKDDYPTEDLKQDFDYLTNLSYFKLLHDKFGKTPEFQDVVAKLQARRISPADFNRVGDILTKITTQKISPQEYNSISATDIYSVANDWFNKDLPIIQKTISDQQAAKKRVPAGIRTRSFNLQKFKSAQLELPPAPVAPPPTDPMQPPTQAEPQSQNILPVNDVGEFISKIIQILSSGNEQAFNAAQSEVVGQVSQDIEQEAQSAFDSLREYLGNTEDEEQIAGILTSVYGLLPTVQNEAPTQMQDPLKDTTMAKSFNLSKYVLNNKPGFQKEAYTNLGDAYLLYGPTEKRICPKLRGKGGGKVGAADVVSEEICRFHCLDGIIIDDNKTVCGEAVWRAHVMDKFSREYVDKDGNIVGGYLNKRFEINRNVPEENKMRLKPGETRKPRPPAWGNTESRLQDLRNKEGQNRGYTPTNEGQPFDWTTDVDQNNVNVDQAERDRREEAMGHQLVQYSKKDEQENDPKVIKKAQYDGLQDYYDSAAMENRATEGETRAKKIIDRARVLLEQNNDSTSVKQILQNEFPNLVDEKELDYYILKGQQKSLDIVASKKSFNLKQHKIAQMTIDAPPATTKKCKHCGSRMMMSKHRDGTERCPNCGKEQKPDFSYPHFVTGPGAKEELAYAETEQNIKEAKKKEDKKDKKGDFEYKNEKFDVNPFAICSKSVGSRKEEPEKWEKCVQDVKKKSKKSFNLKEFKTAQMNADPNSWTPEEYDYQMGDDNSETSRKSYDPKMAVTLYPGEYNAIFGENAHQQTLVTFNNELLRVGKEYNTEISTPFADENKIDFEVKDIGNMPSYMREGLEEDLRSAIDKTMTATHGLTNSTSLGSITSKKKT